MGKFNAGKALTIDKQELDKLLSFIFDKGFTNNLLQNSVSFGLIKNKYKGVLPNFQVSVANVVNKTISISEGFAFDNLGNFIHLNTIGELAIPLPNVFYWLKIKHKYSNFEKGTVNISASGVVNGVGTDFTKVLRGQPNNPVTIAFFNEDGTQAVLNGNFEHTVNDVVSDTVINLGSINLQNEANLRYSVVGSFVRGQVPSLSDKFPYNYDSCNFSLVQETVLNEPPAFGVGENSENTFLIYRLSKDSTNVYIQDKRSKFWQTKSDWEISNIDAAQNKVIGIENIKNSGADSPKSSNYVTVGWGLKGSGSVDSNTLFLNLSTASGGRISSISQAQSENLNFLGWKVFVPNSEFSANVVSSSFPTSNTLRLVLDNVNDNILSSSDFIISPNSENVEFKFLATNTAQSIENEIFSFSISQREAKIPLQVNGLTQEYTVYYRYKNHKEVGVFNIIFDALTSGYYSEDKHDTNGGLINSPFPTKTPYSNGVITLTKSPNSFSEFRDRIDLGDVLGVETHDLNTNGISKVLTVGNSKQHLFVKGTNFTPPPNTDIVISLNTTGAKEGNRFAIIINQSVIIGTIANVTISVRQGNTGTVSDVLLYEFSPMDAFYFSSQTGVLVYAIFDGTNWKVHKSSNFIEPKGSIKLLSTVGAYSPLSKFDNTGLGFDDWFGWALQNGANGTTDARGRFPVCIGGGNNYAVNAVGGADSVTLTADESGLRQHAHTITDPGHTHDYVRATNFQSKSGSGDPSPTAEEVQNTTNSTTGITINNVASLPAINAHENRPLFIAYGFAVKII